MTPLGEKIWVGELDKFRELVYLYGRMKNIHTYLFHW